MQTMSYPDASRVDAVTINARSDDRISLSHVGGANWTREVTSTPPNDIHGPLYYMGRGDRVQRRA